MNAQVLERSALEQGLRMAGATEAQLAFLRAHDCDEAQGYYFSEPLQVPEAAGYLRRQRASVTATAGSL